MEGSYRTLPTFCEQCNLSAQATPEHWKKIESYDKDTANTCTLFQTALSLTSTYYYVPPISGNDRMSKLKRTIAKIEVLLSPNEIVTGKLIPHRFDELQTDRLHSSTLRPTINGIAYSVDSFTWIQHIDGKKAALTIYGFGGLYVRTNQASLDALARKQAALQLELTLHDLLNPANGI